MNRRTKKKLLKRENIRKYTKYRMLSASESLAKLLVENYNDQNRITDCGDLTPRLIPEEEIITVRNHLINKMYHLCNMMKK